MRWFEKKEISEETLDNKKPEEEFLELIEKAKNNVYVPVVELEAGDLLVIPVNIGDRPPQRANESLLKLLEHYRGLLPEGILLMALPHKEGNKFYYPMAIKYKNKKEAK